MKCAYAMAELSHAKRKQVGAIVVSPNSGIIAEGFNGTPPGFDNRCETQVVLCDHKNIFRDERNQRYVCGDCKEFGSDSDIKAPRKSYELVTKPEVIHAELNALAKVACSTNSSIGATIYVTLSPCFDCSVLLIPTKISRIVYAEQYRTTDGLELLRKAGIQVDKLDG